MCNFSKLVCISAIILALVGCGGAEDRKSAYMERGLELVKEGNYEKARLEFKNALQIDPKDAEAHFQLGLAQEKLGEWQGAMSQFLATNKLDASHVEARIHAGQIYLLGNALDKALEEVEAALISEPTNPDALALRGGIRARSSDTSGAFADGFAALKQDPGHVNSIALVSSLHFSKKEPGKAIELLNGGIEKHPENTSLLGLKAKMLMAQKDISGAGKILQDIINVEPDNMIHRYQLASFFISQKQLDNAEKVFRDAAAYESEDNKASLVLIEFLGKHRGYDVAEKELLSEIEKNPEDSTLLFGLAQLYRSKNLDKSIEVLNKIADQNKYGAPDGLKAKSKLAGIYLKLKNIDEAEKLAEEVLTENSQDMDSLTVRGSIALLRNEATKAIADYRSVLSLDPASAKHLRLLARAHAMNGEIELAREALEQAVEATPKDPTIRSELAGVLIRLEKPDLAIEQIQQVLAIAPDNAAALETLFKLQSAKQDWKAALGTADKIKEAFPESPEGYHFSGLIHQRNKEFATSVDEYTKALEISPNAIQPLTQLVRGYMADDNVDEALNRVNKVLNANPKNHLALNMKGEIFLAQKKISEARSTFREAIKTKPDYRTPYVRLAYSYAIEKNMEEVIKVYEMGLKALPNDPVLITGAANVYEQLGQTDKVVTFYEEILEREPSNVLVANNLAMLYVDKVDNADSLSKAGALIKLLENTKNPAFLDTIGWVHYKSGNYKEAVPVLKAAIEQAPKQPILYYHLGMAYFKQGEDMNLARNHLETAINSGRDFAEKSQAEETLKKIQ